MQTTTPTIQPKTVIATFASESRPGHVHEVRLGANGTIYCTCEGWRFQRLSPGLRTCKHTKALMERVTHGGVTLRAQKGATLPEPVRPARRGRKEKPAEPFWTKL